jgi:hypothetical protein
MHAEPLRRRTHVRLGETWIADGEESASRFMNKTIKASNHTAVTSLTGTSNEFHYQYANQIGYSQGRS